MVGSVKDPRPLRERGFSLGYNRLGTSGQLALTVFVYLPDLTNSKTDSAVVVDELQLSVAAIQELVRQGEAYREARLLTRDTVPLGSGARAPVAQRAILRIDSFDAEPVRSLILVTAAKGHVVKIRITQPGSDLSREDSLIRPVLEAIGTTLSR